jgi:hypothetical protein
VLRPLLWLLFRAICGLKVGERLLVFYLEYVADAEGAFNLAIPAFFSAF